MKKLMVLLCCMSSILIFTACGKSENSGEVSKYFDIVRIASSGENAIYCDRNTKVLYYKLYGGFTPIYNADGTLKLYEE